MEFNEFCNILNGASKNKKSINNISEEEALKQIEALEESYRKRQVK